MTSPRDNDRPNARRRSPAKYRPEKYKAVGLPIQAARPLAKGRARDRKFAPDGTPIEGATDRTTAEHFTPLPLWEHRLLRFLKTPKAPWPLQWCKGAPPSGASVGTVVSAWCVRCAASVKDVAVRGPVCVECEAAVKAIAGDLFVSNNWRRRYCTLGALGDGGNEGERT